MRSFNDNTIDHFKKNIIHNLNSDNLIFFKKDKSHKYSELKLFIQLIFGLLKISNHDALVVICDKSFNTYACHVGAFISDIIWIPISVKTPKLDINIIINNFKNPIVLHNNYDTTGLSHEKNHININKVNKNSSNLKKEINFDVNNKRTKVVYFTSGSTGNPKGVSLNLQNIASNIINIKKKINANTKDIFADFHEVSFVISVPILIYCLYSGSSICPAENFDLFQIEKFLNFSKPTIIITVPTLLKLIVKQKIFLRKKTIKTLITCGEPITKDLIININSLLRPKIFYNFYGSTEVGPWVLYADLHKCIENDLFLHSYAPAGKPLDFVKCDIKKNDNTLVVSGPQVSQGYYGGKKNRLNQNKYFEYYTGDIFDLHRDNYFCGGRIDHQFKRNGYRLNILNLEYRFKKALDINDIFVVFLNDEKKLFCFSNLDISQEKIENFKTSLPAYMIPDFFLKFNKQKNTTTGKISRQFLKELALSHYKSLT